MADGHPPPNAKARTLRGLLALHSLVLLVPLLLLAGAVTTLHVMHSRARMEAAARADAWRVLQRIDGHLADQLVWLRQHVAAAAGTDSCPEDPSPGPGTGMALHRPDGRILRDSRPAAMALGAAAAEAVRDAAHGRRPISRLVPDAASGGHALLVIAPSACAEGAAGIVSLAIPAARLRDMLLEAGGDAFHDSRFPALADAGGAIVARWREHERLVGQPMPAAAREVLFRPDGFWQGRNLEGERVAVAHGVSAFSGLAIGVGITRAELDAPFWHSLATMAPLLVTVLLLWLLATVMVTRRIAGPIGELGAAATALAEGRAPPRLATPLREINAVAAAMADAAERRRAAEAQRDLLVRELHHRVKNLLATAQSLATISARTTTDPAGFARQFGDRLRALARTHTLLLEEPGVTAPLSLLLESVLAPYRGGGGRVALSGPPVTLPAETAVALGLVLHELATNAAKYGALSLPEGRVEVSWSEPSPRRIELVWTERGGPPVEAPPTRQGFGSQLLRRALPGAEMRTEWRREGLVLHVALALRGE